MLNNKTYCKAYDGQFDLVTLKNDIDNNIVSSGLLLYLIVDRNNPLNVIFGQTITKTGVKKVIIENNEKHILSRHDDNDYTGKNIKGKNKSHVYKSEDALVLWLPDLVLKQIIDDSLTCNKDNNYQYFDQKYLGQFLFKKFIANNSAKCKEQILLSSPEDLESLKEYFMSFVNNYASLARTKRYLSYPKGSIREKFKNDLSDLIKSPGESIVIAGMGIGKGTAPIKVALDQDKKTILFLSAKPKVLHENNLDVGCWSDFDDVYSLIQTATFIEVFNKNKLVNKFNVDKDKKRIKDYFNSLLMSNKTILVYSKITGLRHKDKSKEKEYNSALKGLKAVHKALKNFDVVLSDECDFANDTEDAKKVYAKLSKHKIIDVNNNAFIKMSGTCYKDIVIAKSKGLKHKNYSIHNIYNEMVENGSYSPVNVFCLERENKSDLINAGLTPSEVNKFVDSGFESINSNQFLTLIDLIFKGDIGEIKPNTKLVGFGNQGLKVWDKSLYSKNILFSFRRIKEIEKLFNSFSRVMYKNFKGQEYFECEDYYFVSASYSDILKKCQIDTGKTDVLNEFLLYSKSIKKNVIICTCESLTRGSNVPDLDGIVVMKNIKSGTNFEQLLGRLFRLSTFQKSLPISERVNTHKTCLILSDQCLQNITIECIINIADTSENKNKSEVYFDSLDLIKNNSFFSYNTFLSKNGALLYEGADSLKNWDSEILKILPEFIIKNHIRSHDALSILVEQYKSSNANLSVKDLQGLSVKKYSSVVLEGKTFGLNSDLESLCTVLNENPLTGKAKEKTAKIEELLSNLLVAIKINLSHKKLLSCHNNMFSIDHYSFPKSIAEFKEQIDLYSLWNNDNPDVEVSLKETIKKYAKFIIVMMESESFSCHIENFIGILNKYPDFIESAIKDEYGSNQCTTPVDIINNTMLNENITDENTYLGVACGLGNIELLVAKKMFNSNNNIHKTACNIYAFDLDETAVNITRLKLYEFYVSKGLDKKFAYEVVKQNIFVYNMTSKNLHRTLQNMKFQKIYGNPPYQKGKNSRFYMDFVKKCFNEYLDEEGTLKFITPNRIFVPSDSDKDLNHFMRRKDVDLKEVIWNVKEMNNWNVKQFVCAWSVQKTSNADNFCKIIKPYNIHNFSLDVPISNQEDFKINKNSLSILNKYFKFKQKLSFDKSKSSQDFVFLSRQFRRWNSKTKCGGKHCFKYYLNKETESKDGKYLNNLSENQTNNFIIFCESFLARYITYAFSGALNIVPFLWKNIPDILSENFKVDQDIYDIFCLNAQEIAEIEKLFDDEIIK